MVLKSENGLETKSQERLYRPFTERRSDIILRDLMNYWTCPIFKNKTLALEKICLYIMRNEANP